MTAYQDDDLALDVAGLRMRYGTVDVLRDVTFQAGHGEVVALLGPNGAGKTTTIEVLEGFRARSAGQVRVLGTDPTHGDERWRARLGVVLQSWRDHRKWRVRELLSHLGRYYTCYSTDSVTRPTDPDELIAAVGLTGQANQQIRTLSGGQRRRLDLAIGIVGRPELLFLDEPTAGLDPQARRDFAELVRGLAQRHRATILLTTHDLDEAERLASRIVVLNHGQIIADGTAEQLAQRIAGPDEVRWNRAGQRFVATTTESTRFVFDLFRQYGDAIADLAVRPSSLEETYLALVRRAESGQRTEAEREPGDPARTEVTR
ncbi:MAG: ABC transporter ATP-binding protein [Natronosporangium sp.]